MEFSPEQIEAETKRFFQKVFGWMFLGLAISGAVAFGVATTPALVTMILGNKLIFWGIIILEFILVISLAAFIKKISANLAMFMFLLYSVLTGLTLSAIFLIFTLGSIGSVFFIAALMFGIMAIYGYTTNADLTNMGKIMFMGLIGIIIAGVFNMFMRSPMIDFITSIIGVIVFTGLTAYDVQHIKKHNIIGNEGTDEDKKEAISGALHLYLDFINLFLRLLNLFGKRR